MLRILNKIRFSSQSNRMKKMGDVKNAINQFKKGETYPNPIVNLDQTRKFASKTLWNMHKNEEVKRESKRILKRHTLTTRDFD